MPRQLRLDDLPTPKFVRFSIVNTANAWSLGKYTDSPYRVSLSTSLWRSQKALLFSIGINETWKQCDWALIGRFSKRRWAVHLLESERIPCQPPCRHNGECRQRRPRVTNNSPLWQHSFFVVYKSKIRFARYTYQNGHQCREICPTTADTLSG